MDVEFPLGLVKAIADGNAVLFVGAGLSIDAGLPGWEKLLAELAEDIALPEARRLDLPQVAQDYVNARDRHSLLNHVLRATDTAGKEPTDNHRRLLRLGIDTWITTNYDNMLEKTLDRAGRSCAKVVQGQDFAYDPALSDAVTVFKLHGDRESPGTIVITTRDYRGFLKPSDLATSVLRVLLGTKTFLYLGYSIRDPDFNRLQNEVAETLGAHQRLAYAVLFDLDDFELRDLRTRGIHPLHIQTGGRQDKSERLSELLDELIRQVRHARGYPSLQQIPPPPPDFTGRETDLEKLEEAIPENGVTVLNLCGKSGMGKTAFALKLAERLKPGYPDAQFYLDLKDMSVEEAMGCVICACQPGASLPDGKIGRAAMYRSALESQKVLLVVDNADDCNQVWDLCCPGSYVLLVTSKEPLPGLEHLHLEALSPEDAQAFLRAKAPAVGSLAPDADTLYPIAEWCGCLPLPLRLAGSALAGRARTPPDVVYPQEYLARLEEARKQKGPLDAALDLSYEMLSADLRHKWRTLAVFPTTFAREAAAAVWDVDAGAARAALEALVEGGLVERGEAAGRYRLHDLLAERVQQYVEGEEETQARRRYARYYAQVTEDAARVGGWRGQKILNQERIHIEAAQGWAERSAPRDPVAVHVCSQFITARGGCMAVGLNVPPRLGVQASPTFGWGTQRALPSWEELEALSPEELRRLQEALRRRLGAD